MRFRVVLYCPDRHLTYDGLTPEAVGVGGGVTARVRMARALARLGHQVTQIVNCPRRETIDGVEYVPLDGAGKIEADVVIFNTSGAALDLTPARALSISARLRIVWLHGTQSPRGMDALGADVHYAVSNFLAKRMVAGWPIRADHIFVTYNGFDAVTLQQAAAAAPARDPYQLIYFSHPSKGLETACAVLERLRVADDRFHLEVAGGERLWGGEEAVRRLPPGVTCHGLLGQRALMCLLLQSAYALQMQDREEPFGLAVVEAMGADTIVVCSPVGALSELVGDSQRGIAVEGDHRHPHVRAEAGRVVLGLHAELLQRERLAQAARAWALDTDTLARAWTQDWQARLGQATPDLAPCEFCGGDAWRLADGDHCSACGLFTRRLAAAVSA